MMNIIELLKTLNAPTSPSGHEDGIAAVLTELVKPLCDEVRTDTLGNVIARRKGNGKRIMLSAHMDSIGMIITHIDDNGFLRFAQIGGLAPALLLSTPVKFANGTRGVIYKTGSSKIAELKLNDCYIDIGATSREDALKYVNIADVAVYDTATFALANDMVVSPYLDDRIACITLLLALEEIKSSENDLYFVFSTQEELGLRGATTAAFAIEPDIGIAIDVTRSGDTPDATPKMECSVGKGAAIKIMDSSLVCSPKLVRALEACAKAHDIPYQFEVLEAGGTDAGAMQRAKAGAYAGAVSIPTRYIHSATEMCSLSDVRASARIIAAFCQDTQEL